MVNVIVLGLVSFFTDLSSEMVYPLIPLYLTSVLGATPVIVGIIEGIAESLASLLKVYSGYISDRSQKKKTIAFAGYATGLVYKLALILAGSWTGVLFARVIDRFGKGIRTAPRDVMVAECANEKNRGLTFGIHKMLDMAGSALGILLAYILLRYYGDSSYLTVFYVSIIPMLCALAMFAFIRQKKEVIISGQREPFWKNIRGLNNQLKLYLIVAFLFTLGNSSNAFLLLKATATGISNQNVLLLYFIYNGVASIFAIPFGRLSDKIGRKHLLVLGYSVFTMTYLVFAFSSNSLMIVLGFVIYGLYTALISGAEKAFIAEIAPQTLKGTMLGLHATLVGISLLPASIIAGLLWKNVGSFAPFLFGAILSLAATIVLQVGMVNKRDEK